MHNLLRILALPEEAAQQCVFVRGREEGGFGFSYDPNTHSTEFHVFIHRQLPFRELSCDRFKSFDAARNHAANVFRDWEMLQWDQSVKRPCEDGGHECGSGSCEMCKTNGGGCTSCGATE